MTVQTLIALLNRFPATMQVAVFDEVWLTALPIQAVYQESGGLVLSADNHRENVVWGGTYGL